MSCAGRLRFRTQGSFICLHKQHGGGTANLFPKLYTLTPKSFPTLNPKPSILRHSGPETLKSMTTGRVWGVARPDILARVSCNVSTLAERIEYMYRYQKIVISAPSRCGKCCHSCCDCVEPETWKPKPEDPNPQLAKPKALCWFPGWS